MREYVVEVNDYPTITIEGYTFRAESMFILREKITRCRDCKHMAEDDYGILESAFYCDRCGYVVPDGFCAWGERRSE